MIDNPYWNEIEKIGIHPGTDFLRRDLVVGVPATQQMKEDVPAAEWDFVRWGLASMGRYRLVGKYAWTITHPASVRFVVHHARHRLLDPMAGTGYWAWLLSQSGVDVLAFDELPGKWSDGEFSTSSDKLHFDVVVGHAPDVTRKYGRDRTLLLAWPPNGDPVAAETLAAYEGNRVIFMGERETAGDDDFHKALDENWINVDWELPVHYQGAHDVIQVYEREGRG